jgi:hypothetical protein
MLRPGITENKHMYRMQELKMHKPKQMLMKNVGAECPIFFNRGIRWNIRHIRGIQSSLPYLWYNFLGKDRGSAGCRLLRNSEYLRKAMPVEWR